MNILQTSIKILGVFFLCTTYPMTHENEIVQKIEKETNNWIFYFEHELQTADNFNYSYWEDLKDNLNCFNQEKKKLDDLLDKYDPTHDLSINKQIENINTEIEKTNSIIVKLISFNLIKPKNVKYWDLDKPKTINSTDIWKNNQSKEIKKKDLNSLPVTNKLKGIKEKFYDDSLLLHSTEKSNKYSLLKNTNKNQPEFAKKTPIITSKPSIKNHYDKNTSDTDTKKPKWDLAQLNAADNVIIIAINALNKDIFLLNQIFSNLSIVEDLSSFCMNINEKIIRIKRQILSIDGTYKISSPSNQYNEDLKEITYDIDITKDLIKEHVININDNYLDELSSKCDNYLMRSSFKSTELTCKVFLELINDLKNTNKRFKTHEPVQKIGPKKTEETLTHQCNNEAEKKITTEKINTQEETVVNKADSDPNTLSPLDNRAAVLQILTHEATDKLNDKQEQTVINKNKSLEFNPDSKTKLPAMNDSLNQQKLSDPPILTKETVQSTDALTNNPNDAKEEDNKTNSSQKNKRVTNISLKKILIGIVIISTIALGYVWYKKGIESGLYLLKKLYK